jgi:hypothetical protein
MARNEIKIRLSTTGKGKTEREIKGVNKSITNLAKSALTLAAAYKGVTFALESVKLAGQLKDLETAHKALTKAQGLNAKTMIDQMQKATRGTVSELELLKQANNALLLGLPVTEKDMANLADAGRRLGRAMGIDAAMGLESLVVGIGRGSKLWLDNLGIIVDTDRAYKDHAASIGKQASALTDAEKKLAFYNETMESVSEKMKTLGEDQETVTDKTEQFSVKVEKLKILLGEGLVPTLTNTITSVNELIDTFVNTDTPIENLFSKLNKLAGKFLEGKLFKDVPSLQDAMGVPEFEAVNFDEVFSNLVLGAKKAAGEIPDVFDFGGGRQSEFEAEQEAARAAAAQAAAQAQALANSQAQAKLGVDILNTRRQEAAALMRILATDKKRTNTAATFVKQEREVVLLKKSQVATSATLAGFQLATARSMGAFASQLSRGLVLFQGMDKFAKSIVASLQRMIQQLATRGLGGLIGGGLSALFGGPFVIGAFIGSGGLFGSRQHGGPVAAGQPVIVGERRPELFIPDRPGTVVPEVPRGDLIVNLNGPFYGNVDDLAEEIANRSDQNFNRIKVNA